MTIGLVGVTISLILGIFLGGISGYFGGWIDDVIQRTIDFLRSLPTIPLWLGLAAALPVTWGPLQIYFAITIILSLIGWTALARVVRGRRNRDERQEGDKEQPIRSKQGILPGIWRAAEPSAA